jgi:hypothetical protein
MVTSIAIAGVVAASMLQPRSALAQGASPAGAPESTQELAKKIVNPLTDVVSVPLQFNWINGVGPNEELRTVTYFQPVLPMSINEKWNLIGRWMMPYLSQPSAFGGSSGLGDIMAQVFFSPKSSNGFTWGAGPMFSLPTTTDPTLGLGKWAAGPAAAVMRQKGAMTYGMLVNNIWSFAGTGTEPRPDVNMGYFQPVIAHTSTGGVTVMASTEAVADWGAPNPDDRWAIPINAMVSKLTHFGMVPMNVQFGAGYYVAKPTYGPSWQLRTTFTLIMPRQR